jgi:hypothetical protein
MRKVTAFVFFIVFVFFAGLNPPLFAQEAESEEEEDWEGVTPSLYSSGDYNFAMSVGVAVPMLFNNTNEIIAPNLNVGGVGSLAYNYFLTPHIFLGGEIGFMFAGTLGGNMLYVVPFGLRVGYQFVFGKFEFPVSLLVGAAPQTYLETNYFGLFVKPMASVFFRFNPDWSFGLNTAWWFVPEWTQNSSKDMNAHFLELTLSARYHL